MKFSLFVFATVIFILPIKAICQGVELIPDGIYDTIPAPPLEAGAGLIVEEYSIPKLYFPPPGDQLETNSCVGWALGYAYMSFYQRTKEIGATSTTFSPWYIYKSLKKCSDCKCNLRIDYALNFIRDVGNVPINLYPYDSVNCLSPNPNLTPSPKMRTIANQYRAPTYRRVNEKLNLNEVKGYLIQNIPIFAIIKINEKFGKYKDESERKPFNLPRPLNFDYHAVLIVGYNDRMANGNGALKILNSHGEKWGTKGFGWITYESYRQMIEQAFIFQNENNELLQLASEERNQNQILAGSSAREEIKTNQEKIKPISPEDFTVYGSSEFVRKDRYYFTYSISAKPEILASVKKVDYIYDHGSFINKVSTSIESPNFANSYEGWGCLNNMSAIVYLSNDSTVKLNFNGCRIIDNGSIKAKDDPASVVVTPHVSVNTLPYKKFSKNKYNFKIELRGLEPIKFSVDSVSYYWNEKTLDNVSTIKNSFDFSNGYIGWGCLENLDIIIYFSNNSQKKLTLNMCDQIGWSDRKIGDN